MPTSSIPASGGGGLRPYYQKFTSSGTFTLPDGYGAANPLLIDIQVIGGGGGGSGSSYNSFTVNNTIIFRGSQHDYFGNSTEFNSAALSAPGSFAAADLMNNTDGRGGGSGGIAKTQMSLTGPLTITVGAAGAKHTSFTQNVPDANFTLFWKRDFSNNNGITDERNSYSVPAAVAVNGGSGGTSTAGAVSATGGSPGNANFGGYLNMRISNWSRTNGYTPTVVNNANYNSGYSAQNHGTAGSPAGSAGGATPLLGALSGGSGTTTPVYGAFGVGGKKGDGNTHTGVEGTGGGHGSIGASGAVIITYWA
jgi:hypothetical protein